MAGEFNNEMRGVLFRVKEKRSKDGPDYWGRLQIEGIGYRLAAWSNVSERGVKYWSLRVSLSEQKADQTTDDVEDDDEPTPRPPKATAARRPSKPPSKVEAVKKGTQKPLDLDDEVPF